MFERASTIIRDGSKLDYSYIPVRLVHREEQMARLEMLFRPLAEQGRQCSAFLTGGVGTGKTATAGRFCSDLSEYMARSGRPTDTVYVNCRNSTEKGALLQIVKHFDPGYPTRGFSNEDIARAMTSHLAENRRSLVVVLDEVDVLLKRGTTDMVYQLTRGGGERAAPVSLIMISQEPLDGLLDEASLSTFRRTNTVRFNRYSRQELSEIVASRAEEALFPGRITDDAIELIAEQASEYGDARMAIELLDRAANIAEEDPDGEVTTEHVRAAKAMIYSSVSESRLRSLDVNRKAVLLAIARGMKENLTIPAPAAEKIYAVVCEEYGLQARKHTQYWTYLQDLEKQGIVRLAVQVDASGRAVAISLPDIPSKVLAEKMEALMEEEIGGAGKVRPLRRRCRDLHKVQRHPSVRQALHALRGPQGEEGDPQADRRPRRRQDSCGRVRRQGQHGRPEDDLLGVRPQERGGGACDHHRRRHRRVQASER